MNAFNAAVSFAGSVIRVTRTVISKAFLVLTVVASFSAAYTQVESLVELSQLPQWREAHDLGTQLRLGMNAVKGLAPAGKKR